MRTFLTYSGALIATSIVPLLNALAEVEEHTAHHQPSIIELVPSWINFSIYCALMYFILRKPLTAAWLKRVDSIAALVHQGEEEHAAADKDLREAKKQFSSLEANIRLLNEQIEAEAENESGLILKEAEEHVARLSAQTRELVAAESRATENAIKAELSERILSQALVKLQRQVTPESDKDCRAASINGLGALLQRN